jgi:hypothetical protein
LGDTTFDRKGKKINTTLSPTMQGFADTMSGYAGQYASGNSPTSPFQQFAMGQVQGDMPGLYDQGMQAANVDPFAYARYDQQLGNVAGQMGASAGQMGGTAQMMQNLGMGLFGGVVPGMGMAMNTYGQGQGMLNERAQSYQSVADQQLAQMRAASAPYEERAGLALQQNLFNTGRMGTRGGGQNIQDFATGLGRADTQRVLDSQGFAEQLYGRDQQAALARNQMGAGLMGQGMQGLFQGYGQQNQNYQLGGQMLSNAGSLYGQQGQLFGQQGNLFNNQFTGATQYNDTVNARAQQRLQNATGMFGFGNELAGTDMARAGTAMTGYTGLAGALQGQAEFGANMGTAAMGTGQATGGTNPMGGFLQGLGGAVSGMNLQDMFNPKPTFNNSYFNTPGFTPGNYAVTPNPNLGSIKMPTPNLGG